MEVIAKQICNGCEQSVSKIKKRYKGKKYCSTCYVRIFKKSFCPTCGALARLSRDDDQAKCNQCIKKQPCIRCNSTNKPIGKLTEYGVVCNSCSVYFRKVEQCERCKIPSQKLTRISRFKDDLRVCTKCATRDYETCPFCRKYRLLELDENGSKICTKCKVNDSKPCLSCMKMIAAGCSDLCDDCYWNENLWKKYNKNIGLFEYSFLITQYKNYTFWLANQVGIHKAALYLNKHTHFFIKTEMLWSDSFPDANHLLSILRANGLRKFELVMQWMDEVNGIRIPSISKKECSEKDQTRKLIESLPQASLAYDVVTAYKQRLDVKISQGVTSARSVRLAIKPAVALMLSISQDGTLLPNLEHIKLYLSECLGQTAALTGFINFLDDQYNTNIDYISFKKSSFIQDARKKNLENDLIEMISSTQSVDTLVWAKKGMQFFHDMGYKQTLGVKAEMIVEVQDGYNVLYNNQNYWLPKSIDYFHKK